MATAPTVPLNKVQSRTVDFLSFNRLPEEPYAVYTFGGLRKVFFSDRQGEGVYGKPVVIVDGVTVHLPDPDLLLPGGVVVAPLTGVGVVIPCPGLVPCNPTVLSGMSIPMPSTALAPSYTVGLSGVSSNIVS